MVRDPSASSAAGRRPRAGRDADPLAAAAAPEVAVRPARRADLEAVFAIDAVVTGIEKQAYWESVYRRYGQGGQAGRHFLVAESGRRVVGFVIGEVRDWEFGSPPCGWVFAIDVDPAARLGGVGTRLLDAISARFRAAGVTKLRTMLSRDNALILSFFRSQGLTAGPFVTLETDLGTGAAGERR